MSLNDNLPSHVDRAVSILVQKLKLKNPKYTVSTGAENGETYSGVVARVRVNSEGVKQTTDKLSMDNQYQFIIKMPASAPERYNRFNVGELYRREEYAYDKVLPTFEHFQENNLSHKESFHAYPHKYVSWTELPTREYIILNDLKASRDEEPFHLMKRTAVLDYKKSVLVMENLAHLHAISLAMKTHVPTKLPAITNSMKEIIFNSNSAQPDSMIYRVSKQAMERFIPSSKIDKIKDAQLLRRLEIFKKHFIPIMQAATQSDNHSAIIHGDCWISNLMFRGETEMRFLDWQCMRYASVAVDISHFLFCSLDKEGRKRTEELIYDIYLKALQNHLVKLEGISRGFSEDTLRQQMRKYAKYGVGMAVLTLHANTNEHLHDVQSMLDSVNFIQRVQEGNESLLKGNAYIERMEDVFRDADQMGYMDDLDLM